VDSAGRHCRNTPWSHLRGAPVIASHRERAGRVKTAKRRSAANGSLEASALPQNLEPERRTSIRTFATHSSPKIRRVTTSAAAPPNGTVIGVIVSSQRRVRVDRSSLVASSHARPARSQFSNPAGFDSSFDQMRSPTFPSAHAGRLLPVFQLRPTRCTPRLERSNQVDLLDGPEAQWKARVLADEYQHLAMADPKQISVPITHGQRGVSDPGALLGSDMRASTRVALTPRLLHRATGRTRQRAPQTAAL
jgi:hypothetical protein